jgi:hypothetical protein
MVLLPPRTPWVRDVVDLFRSVAPVRLIVVGGDLAEDAPHAAKAHPFIQITMRH